MNQFPRASVVISSYHEADRPLQPLSIVLADAHEVEFDVRVVFGGCTDETAERALTRPWVVGREIGEPSEIAALREDENGLP